MELEFSSKLASILRRPRASGRAAAERRVPTLTDSFPEQWEYETSRDLFNAVTCSRRSGKTHGAVDRHILVQADSPPGSWTHFGSLIRRNARKHFWNPLKKRLDCLGWKYHKDDTEMILELKGAGFMQAFSCDDMAGTKAVQGDGSALFTLDECHLPNDDVLQALVEVAEPMLTDRGGMMDLLGLQPEVPGGFYAGALGWTEDTGEADEDSDDAEDAAKAAAIASRGGGWRCFSWTMFDHDFPRPREAKLADVLERCRRRGLPVEIITTMGADGRPRYDCGPGTHPIVARQYFGKRRSDPSKLAYEYRMGRNDYDPAKVDFSRDTVRHAVGLDIGFSDHDAISVGSYFTDDQQRRLYRRWTWRHNHLDVDDLAGVLEAVRCAYPHAAASGDHGGHGAVKVLETLQRRLRFRFAAKPPDVMLSVGLVNDDFRTSRGLLPTVDIETARVLAALDALIASRKDSDGRPRDPARDERTRQLIIAGSQHNDMSMVRQLAKEFGLVLRKVNRQTRKIEINKSGFHSDLTESDRYMHHAARHWAAKAPRPEIDTSAESRTERRARMEAEAAAKQERIARLRPWQRRRRAA